MSQGFILFLLIKMINVAPLFKEKKMREWK